MSDAYGPSGGQMLRRAFLWTIGCGAAAFTVPKYFDQLGFSSILAPAEPEPLQLPPKQHPTATPPRRNRRMRMFPPRPLPSLNDSAR